MSQRQLIVRLRNWIGDVVLGIPALEHLQSHGYALTLVGKGWAQGLLAGHGWTVHTLPGGRRERVQLLARLRRDARERDPGFDQRPNMLLGPFSFSSALEARLAGLRPVGHAYDGRSLLLARAVTLRRDAHELQNYWQLACQLTGHNGPAPDHITLRLTETARQAARQRLAAAGLAPGFVMLCPFAGGKVDGQDKRWPGFKDFAVLAQAAWQRPLVMCPGPDEEEQARRDFPQATVLPGVPLDEYAALIEQAALMVSNDTGPGHMAAALGRPVLSVLGPTPAGRWRPWGPQVVIVQRAEGWPHADEVLRGGLAMLATPDRVAA